MKGVPPLTAIVAQPGGPPRGQVAGQQQPKTVVVKTGDTLEHLAGKFYGTRWTRDWWTIYEANKARIGKNPDLIFTGERLVIPPADVAVPAPASAQAQANAVSAQPASAGELNGSEDGWIDEFLQKLDAPETAADVASLQEWIAEESPWNSDTSDGAQATWNPLNTEEGHFGSTGSMNSSGVSVYPDELDGLDAEVYVLRSHVGYEPLIAALQNGDGLCAPNKGLALWSGYPTDGGYDTACPAS
jgi:LysM repeat protein